MIDDRYIFDCEVFAFDWLFVFKHKTTKEYTVIHNDNEAVRQFMEQEPLLGGFNNKHYDQFILKAVLCDYTPEQVKAVNDFIIVQGHEGWEHPDPVSYTHLDVYKRQQIYSYQQRKLQNRQQQSEGSNLFL